MIPILPRGGVEAVERALAIMDTLGAAGRPLQLRDLAARTALPKATIMRVASSLERFGYLQKGAGGAYWLGPALWRLGSAFRQQLDLEPHVRPALQALVDATQESASFWVRQGPERICLYRVNAPRTARSHVDEGELSPLDRSSAGHVIAHHAGLPTTFGPTLERDGVVVTLGERDPDVASISAPVFGPGGQCLGALTLAGILNRFQPEVPRYIPLVRAAAEALSERLGGAEAEVA